ncbi:MAG: NAD-dependent epimerase/dehydratase family protein, partial [Proteobacteria bacterium]
MVKKSKVSARKILVTGGAGFIGSNFVDDAVSAGDDIVVLDALTYAGHSENLNEVLNDIEFVQGDICNRDLVRSLFEQHDFDTVIN